MVTGEWTEIIDRIHDGEITCTERLSLQHVRPRTLVIELYNIISDNCMQNNEFAFHAIIHN